jgi:hypothetical protein
MKLLNKLALSFFAAISTQSVMAQVQKTMVLEHFTNSVCSICSSRNPGLFNNIAQQDNLIQISFHPSSPYSSCLLNKYDKVGNDGRTNFYGIFGSTPRIVINGTVISASTNYNLSSIFDSYKNQTSAFEMKSSLQANPDSFVSVTSIYKRSESALTTATLAVFAAEDSLAYNAPNGEKLHHNVYRNNFSNSNITLPSAIGDSITIRHAIKKDVSLKENYVHAIAILQDNKTLIQASKSGQAPSMQTNSAKALKINNITTYPNPANSSINLPANTENGLIKIYGLSGNLMLSQQINGPINVNQLPDGFYTFTVQKNTEIYTGKGSSPKFGD